MKTIKILAGAVLVIALAGCSDIALRGIIAQQVTTGSGAPPTIRVLSMDVSRSSAWTLNGTNMVTARSKLLNPLNFGPNGTVKKTITITDTTATITAGLLSNYDVLFIGYVPDAALSGAELTAMQNWVSSGGVIIATSDDGTHDAVTTAFGYQVAASPVADNYAYPNAGNPPVFNGPFGTASIVLGAFNIGFWFTLSGVTLLGSGYNINFTVYSSVLELHWGAGKVIMLADVNYISDDTGAFSAGIGIDPSNSNDIFLGNLFDYAHK